MSAHVLWTERRFSFDFPAGVYPEIMERLRGTPARARSLVERLAPERLIQRVGGKWSVQEHVGHLLDLEALFDGRLDDYDAATPTLRAADMSNRATEEARHNQVTIESILTRFGRERERIVARLEGMDAERFARSALHPRLETPMRIVDMMYFQSEHDDYHLARVSELIRRLG